MIDSVLNEYVHVDFYESRHPLDHDREPVIVYESLDNVAEGRTLEGEIVLTHMQHKIPFRSGPWFLDIDSDLVFWGKLQNNNTIILCWRNEPGDHYLTASYDLAGKEEEKVAWLQEGF